MGEFLGNYGFRFLSDVPNPPIRLFAVGIEKRDSPTYYFDNKNRENAYLFQYTLSGSGTVEIDGITQRVNAGDAFFFELPGNEKYYFDAENNTSPWHFIYIMFTGDSALQYYEFIQSKAGKVCTRKRNDPCITALFELFRRARLGLIQDSFTAERLTFDFLCKLCASCFANEAECSDIVIAATRIIEHEFSTLEGIFDVAQRLGITQNHLSRLFTAEMKTTPIAYLTKIRLQRAVNLLNASRKSIEDIARECGFSCGNYFGKVFLKYIGISPLQYRIHANSTSASFDHIKI